MNKICGVIEETFEAMLLDYKNTKVQCKDFKQKLSEAEILLTNTSEELRGLKLAKEKLDDDLQNLKNEYEDVVQVKNHFYHNILRKKHLLDELTQQQSKVSQENDTLRAENEKLREETFLLRSEKELCQKRFENLRTEGESLKFQCERLRIKLCNIENEMDNFNAFSRNFEMNLAKNCGNFEVTSEICEDLNKRIQVGLC